MIRSPVDKSGDQDDQPIDGVPIERLSACELGVEDKMPPNEYTRVPATTYHLFPASARLLLALLFAQRTFNRSCPDGWVKLGKSLTSRFRLTDKDVRRRAVAALEREGRVEVQRRKGSCTALRLKS